jgi:protein tyrosine phosphatase (PTP) superfamily phosphohydrolase (DUF442 family)
MEPRETGQGSAMARVVGWLLAVCMAATLIAVPYLYYRSQYAHAKRLRVVTAGTLYRSGQLTAAGLDEAIARHKFRTIINLQNEDPDPELVGGPRESQFCRQRGVRYVFIPPDLVDPKEVPAQRPAAIDAFLAVMDDPCNHPVLLHCRAGLHRTGVLAAVYRMEYEGWSPERARTELRANGFGDSQATARNDYIMQYLLMYQPRKGTSVRGPSSVVRGNLPAGDRTTDNGQRTADAPP